MLFHNLISNQTWQFSYADTDRDLIGGSLVFHRRYWERYKFPTDRRQGSDSIFTGSMSIAEYDEIALPLDNWLFYVAFDHHDNTCKTRQYIGSRWRRWPGELPKLLGRDYDRYRDGVTTANGRSAP